MREVDEGGSEGKGGVLNVEVSGRRGGGEE